MTPDRACWEPLTPTEVTALLADAPLPWWIAGGWAIDLFIGRRTRDHADIDVLILREDQLTVQHVLRGWDLHAADPPGELRQWVPGEHLTREVRDVWCRRTPTSPWSLQLMIDDATGGVWRYRRDVRISRPVSELDSHACFGRPPVLSPAVQLLHKSRSRRPKDEANFHAARRLLGSAERSWLVTALEQVSPHHDWLKHLRGA